MKDANAWYAHDVETAIAAKILNCIGDCEFAPDAKITREQISTMIVRANFILACSLART